MNTSSNVLVSIAALKAKAGKEQALKEELLTLIEPTRAEPGNLDCLIIQPVEPHHLGRVWTRPADQFAPGRAFTPNCATM